MRATFVKSPSATTRYLHTISVEKAKALNQFKQQLIAKRYRASTIRTYTNPTQLLLFYKTWLWYILMAKKSLEGRWPQIESCDQSRIEGQPENHLIITKPYLLRKG